MKAGSFGETKMPELKADAKTGPRLRSIVTIVVGALALMAIGVSSSLIVMSTNLHLAGNVLRDSVRIVRLTEEAQAKLFTYEHVERDGSDRARIADDLRAKLDVAAAGAASEAETTAIAHAKSAVNRYVTATELSEQSAHEQNLLFDAAYEALEHVVNMNVARADSAREYTARWDRLGNIIGIATAVLMPTVLALLLFWITRSVVRPMLALSDAMDRFAGGELDARAPPFGAAELQRMSSRFNTMADAMGRQRRERLTYLAGIAHDLRNPLAALQMSTILVDPDKPLPPEDRVRNVLSLVRRQVTRLTRMVTDILDAASIEAGHLTLELGEHDVREVIHGVAALFEGTSVVHEFDVELPDEPLLVRCDPLRIEQTLTNLVSNAIKYSPKGGLIQIAARIDDDAIAIAVTDHGVGIPEKEIARLWEPFRRSALSNGTIPGVGLGLSTAKRIVDAHGGRIDVTSALGAGSTFIVRLPLASGPISDDPTRRRPLGFTPRSRRRPPGAPPRA